MEPLQKSRRPDPWQRARKLMARLWNLKEKLSNRDFGDFSTLEYERVRPEDIRDSQRLKYHRNLDMAKTGHADASLNDLISYHRKKEGLVKLDQGVVAMGTIKVRENDDLLASVRIGYDRHRKALVMALRDHDNIPIWKPLDWPELLGRLSSLHPKATDGLEFGHSFFARDIQRTVPSDFESLGKMYDLIIEKSFGSNKYFGKGVLPLDAGVLEHPMEHLHRPILFPASIKGHEILRLTEANADYLVFQPFLKTSSVILHLTREEIQEMLRNERVDRIAKLRFGLVLGIREGQLYIGKANGKKTRGMDWTTFREAMEFPAHSAKVKYYLAKKIVKEKDFVIEKGAIRLESSGRTAHLKRHYKNGQWYFAETGRNNQELHFRPADGPVMGHLRTHFVDSENLQMALDAIKEQKLDIRKIENTLNI
ncbi:hypothetical protein [Flagellimonas hadalis]|uniref:Uncharacterized protein n=1 Tax=Flagellimonas hadalis TaxID=2597517 RepID=A0A5N5IT46_9FLAO|nr:hypothetical protein [Allomuricauda hadalis]KAB5484219.1 hypothetical protein FOT42_016860 [Allomuricauda hadalis]